MGDSCMTIGDLAGVLLQIETRHRGIYIHSAVDGCVQNKLSEKICNQKCLYKMETHTFLTLRSFWLVSFCVAYGTFKVLLLNPDWGLRYPQCHGWSHQK